MGACCTNPKDIERRCNNSPVTAQTQPRLNKPEEQKQTQVTGQPNISGVVSSQAQAKRGISSTNGGQPTGMAALTRSVTDKVDFQITSGMFMLKYNEAIQDKYTLLDQLGKGSYGVAVKAIHKETNEERAIKTMAKRKVSKAQRKITQFNSEIEILQTLDHPGTLRLYEAYEDQKNYYLVSEYCSGGELFDYVVEQQYLTEAMAGQLMLQIMRSINYCHAKGIMHRDIKPENILLLRKPESAEEIPELKLIDFGTSIVKKSNQVVSDRVGTVYYIAPEVHQKQAYNEKCDVWSAGIIMYILLCGYPPFNGETDQQIFEQILNGDLIFDPTEWSGVSYNAQNLIHSMLSRDQERRLSAQQVLEHPWMQQVLRNESANTVNLAETLDRLQNFNATRKLQMAVATYITSQILRQEEVEDLKRTFLELDENNDGRLSHEELIRGYNTAMNLQLSLEEIQSVLRKVDADNSGYIEYNEFITSTVEKSVMLTKRNLELAFNAFDKDKSGTISVSEVKQILGGGLLKGDDMFEQVVKEVDENGDGEIDMEEFKRMMRKIYSV